MSCCVVCRRSSDPELLWLWHRLAATAVIRPLVWESPYAMGMALEKTKRLKKKKKKNDVNCGLVMYGPYYVELYSFYTQFVEVLS